MRGPGCRSGDLGAQAAARLLWAPGKELEKAVRQEPAGKTSPGPPSCTKRGNGKPNRHRPLRNRGQGEPGRSGGER